MENKWSLEGKTVLVTGATKGIGKAIVEELIRWNAAVFVVARNMDLILEQLEEYRKQGATVYGVAADVTTVGGRDSLMAEVQERWQKVDILINNVGSNIRKSTLETTVEDLRKVMQMNVESAFELSKATYPLLKNSKQPSIVNIASIASLRAIKLTTAIYSMSKAAMEQMTNYLAVEWGKEGIRVNSVHPWFIETPLTKSVLEDEDKLRIITQNTPLGRVGTSEEVASAVVFLCSPAASYLNGVNLPIDGGFSKVGVM